MGTQNICAALLLVVSGLLQCLGQQDLEHQYKAVKYGDPCLRDRNCIDFAFCKSQKVCACETYYSPSADRLCIASEGTPCTDGHECASMANATCRQGKCACKDGYLLDTRNSSNCISRPMKEGDRCQREEDCQDSLGRAMCLGDHCRCVTNYHFSNATGNCMQTRGLYNPCRNSNECMSLDKKQVLECRNGECLCAQGQIGCSKASLRAILGIPVVFLALLHRLI
ncbi:uncharacterized protein LOC143215673 [Lasioglossum baleicum]|uniref:uncharacterized protein LOC143215673 n=1 Tax=Lasioglossum baleicum TaxID=434251 RepID=UPI003FCE5F76